MTLRETDQLHRHRSLYQKNPLIQGIFLHFERTGKDWNEEISDALLEKFIGKTELTKAQANYADHREKLELELQLEKMNEAIKKMKQPIESVEALLETADDIEHQDHLYKKVNDLTLDQVDLDFILALDVTSFLDKQALIKLEEDKAKMYFNDSVQSILGKEDHEVELEAMNEWRNHSHEILEEINKIRTEGREGPTGLGLIPYLEAEVKDGRDKWIKRRIAEKKIEKSKAIKLLHREEDAELIKNISLIFEENKAIQIEKMHQYIKVQSELLEHKFNQLEKQSHKTGLPLPEAMAQMKEVIEEGQRLYANPSIKDPKELKNIAKSFLATKDALHRISLEAKEGKSHSNPFGRSQKKEGEEVFDQVKENEKAKVEIRNNVERKYKRLKEVLAEMAKVDPAQLAAQTGETYPLQAEQIQTEQGAVTLEAIHKKNLAGLATIQGMDTETLAHMEVLDSRVKELQAMNGVDLYNLNEDLETITKTLSDRADAHKAGATIAALETANTAADLERILLEQLGEKHLRPVSEKDFNDNYKQYTKKGDMVFYERGDEWAIIFNRDAFHKPDADINFLKKQITHELLHLEFEKNHEKKEEVRNALIFSTPAQWNEIKTAFLAMVNDPTNKKAAPTDAGWRDDDILSEIYAMQHELGKTFKEPKTPKNKLNNLLLAAGTAAKLKGLTDQTEAYKKDDPEIFRGFEGSEDSEAASAPKQGEAISYTQGTHDKFKETIDSNEERLSQLLKNPLLDYIVGARDLAEAMLIYNGHTAELNQQLLKVSDGSVISTAINGRNAKVDEDLKKIESTLGEVAKNQDNTSMGFLMRNWNNTAFISLAGFVQLGTDVKEFFARALKRRTTDQAARLGMAFFAGTGMGREAKARQLKSEADEVSEWQQRYTNLDPWQLLDELKSIATSPMPPNKDQLKAVLRLLAEKGRLNWQDPYLWKVLNKLQTSSNFPEGDQMLLKDPVLLREKMLRALGEMYDYDEFPSLERNNEDKYEGFKKQYDKTHDKTASKMTERMDELLITKKNGGKVDPQLYESLIENCMIQGRSYGENVMFHLLAGMASGILSADRAMALTRNQNAWPPMEWFTTLSPPYTQADYQNLCNTHFKEAYESGTLNKGGEAFKSWFWSTIQTNKAVIQRAKKAVGDRAFDHDWTRTIACLFDVDTMQRFFAGRGGQKETKITAVGNAIAGMTQLLEENAKNQTNADRNEFARIASIMAMTEGILNGTYKGEDDTITRGTPEINDEPPRESGVGHHKGLSVQGHRNINTNFLMQIDGTFFTMLKNLGEVKDKKLQKDAGKDLVDYLIDEYPSLRTDLNPEMDLKQVYDRLGRITQAMFKAMSEEEFQAILKNFAAK